MLDIVRREHSEKWELNILSNQALSELIKAGRESLGWTQDALAEACGCSRSSIAQYERGIRPPKERLDRILSYFPEDVAEEIRSSKDGIEIPLGANDEKKLGLLADGEGDDFIEQLMSKRRSRQIDIAGQWDAMWRTTVNNEENRNREIIDVRKRWNNSWQFSNQEISEDNPEGGYLWIGRLELFDNRHLLGHYCAKHSNILAKGVMCLELQTNGREMIGVWDGLNFDTMWASGMVALSRIEQGSTDPAVLLDQFIANRPSMPY